MGVAVIGLGELGSLITRGLTHIHQRVVGFDPDPAAGADLVASDYTRAAGMPQVCDDGVTLFLIAVATAEQLSAAAQAVVAGTAGADRAITLVVHATVGPDAVLGLASRLPQRVTLVDAPVTIRRDDSLRRCVCFLGGAPGTEAALAPVLTAYCREVVRVGDLGAGQLVKLVNNTMSLVNTVAAAEALELAARSGLDPGIVRALVQTGSGASQALATWPIREPLFAPWAGSDRRRELALKDLVAAVEAGNAVGLDLPLTRCAADALRAVTP